MLVLESTDADIQAIESFKTVFICFIPVLSIGNSKIKQNNCPKELTSFVIRKDGEKII